MATSSKRARKRILTASTGLVAFTALEGLACGNPVAPGYESSQQSASTAPSEAPPAATSTQSAPPSETK